MMRTAYLTLIIVAAMTAGLYAGRRRRGTKVG